MNNEPIVFEQTCNAPAHKVWQALTDKDTMKQWYFDIEPFEAKAGFQFEFAGGPDDKQYIHLCEVKEVIPNEKISYSWCYEGYPGKTLVEFELNPDGDQTNVKLTHSGVETFPEDNPDFAKANFVAGWKDIVTVNLKNFVETL